MKNEVAAVHGETTIEIRLRFLTDDIAESKEKRKIVPKHCWTMGLACIPKNKSHGIGYREIHFDSLMEIPAKIEELIIKEGITLHTCRKMEKYIKRNQDA